jgi:hypothetical protein
MPGVMLETTALTVFTNCPTLTDSRKCVIAPDCLLVAKLTPVTHTEQIRVSRHISIPLYPFRALRLPAPSVAWLV